MNEEIKTNQHLYYAQILQSVGEYNVLEMIVCTLYKTYFAAMEKLAKQFSSTEVST